MAIAAFMLELLNLGQNVGGFLLHGIGKVIHVETKQPVRVSLYRVENARSSEKLHGRQTSEATRFPPPGTNHIP